VTAGEEPPALAVRGLVAGWGAEPVLRGVSFDVAAGEVVALLGGNGSGKSTLLATLSGLLRPRAGSIELSGRRVDGLGAEHRAAAGLRLLSQTRRVFPSLSVRANLAAPALAVGRPDVAALGRRAQQWLDRFPVLAERAAEPAASLSGGQQQLLAIGRVVTTLPRVLLLDEPSAGLSGEVERQCAAVFRELRDDGAALVLVEQDVRFARSLADRVLHLREGQLAP